jgi:hypothetical protein
MDDRRGLAGLNFFFCFFAVMFGETACLRWYLLNRYEWDDGPASVAWRMREVALLPETIVITEHSQCFPRAVTTIDNEREDIKSRLVKRRYRRHLIGLDSLFPKTSTITRK